MRVDILMCTYNGEDFIEQQIQSILDQTHKDFKLIIVDDISSDRTVEILKKLILTDDRIEFHQNEKNLGYFNNFLSGLKYVKSEYLFFADQDDIWLKNKIEIQLADLVKEDENVLMNFSNSYLLYNESDVNTICKSKRDPNKIKPYYSFPIDLALKNIVAGHTILIRSNQIPYIIERMSKIKDRNKIYFDYVLTLILLDVGKIKFLNKSLVYFRQHPNSTSTKMRMNYYIYVASNAYAISQISTSRKMVNYFSVLNQTISKKPNFSTYVKLLRQNLINFNYILNNYDFYKIDKKPSFFKRIYMCFSLSYRFSVLK
ncbi:rhamnosyltransferase [Halpernia humi]|uniref:Rhamnosyltransferase n=1 Tax=Halpernia humi TaxID=493375 RepID=A0A1H5YN36_9FLAO|nr:glycosyltransferase [Halpernia humi]SEG25573.1 rhamnosyltransferase [Halpernia humi]